MAVVFVGCGSTQNATTKNNKAVAQPADSADVEKKVYITEGGDKYHSDGCQFLSKSKIAIALAKARMSHTPCSRCAPPE